MKQWIKNIDWVEIGGYLVLMVFWLGVFGFLFRQQIYDYFAPVYYKPCTVEAINYDTVNIDKGKSRYETSRIETVGQNGSKQVCKASKSGYPNKETVVKQPVNQVVRYTPTSKAAYDCIYNDNCKEAMDEGEPDYNDEYMEYMESQQERGGAICRDGTRSYSTGRGTCSHHGGVSEWLYE